jgi:hypothetical protein
MISGKTGQRTMGGRAALAFRKGHGGPLRERRRLAQGAWKLRGNKRSDERDAGSRARFLANAALEQELKEGAPGLPPLTPAPAPVAGDPPGLRAEAGPLPAAAACGVARLSLVPCSRRGGEGSGRG